MRKVVAKKDCVFEPHSTRPPCGLTTRDGEWWSGPHKAESDIWGELVHLNATRELRPSLGLNDFK